MYAQSINFDNEDQNANAKKEGYKMLFDNNKVLLQKTKSTLNNELAIIKKKKQQQKVIENKGNNDLSLVVINENSYERFLASIANDDDDDVDDDETNKSYYMLDDDIQVINNIGFFLNNYIHMIFTYKQFANVLLLLLAVAFIIVFAIRLMFKRCCFKK